MVLTGDLAPHPDSLYERVSFECIGVQGMPKLSFLSAEGFDDAFYFSRAQLRISLGVSICFQEGKAD